MQVLLPGPLPTGLEPSIYAALGIGPFRTIFDIGANVGQSAHHLARGFPKAQIYCFEPVASTYTALIQETRELQNVRTTNLALGERHSSVRVTAEINSERNHIVPLGMDEPNTVIATMDTVDRFCDRHGIDGPDLLKTDTEGHDLQVLRGARERLLRPIKAVLVEIGMLATDTRHSRFSEISAYLAQCDFTVCGIYEAQYKRDGRLNFANALFVRQPRSKPSTPLNGN